MKKKKIRQNISMFSEREKELTITPPFKSWCLGFRARRVSTGKRARYVTVPEKRGLMCRVKSTGVVSFIAVGVGKHTCRMV